MVRCLLVVAIGLLSLSPTVQAIPGCAAVTASDGLVLNADPAGHGLHLWYHEDEVEAWVELNGLAGLQYSPCLVGYTQYDADGRVL